MTLFIISFIAGALTVLAPCILPLLPVILGGAVADAGNRRRPLIIIVSLSLSVFVFTLLLKGSTALINVSPSFWTYISAIILVVFGLTLLFPETWARVMLKIPGHNRPDAWLSKGYMHRGSLWADILVGAALGPVFTTCSPTFFVILATVLPQSLAVGLIDLAAYIIGLALALLLISIIGQRLVNRLEWVADPKGWFKRSLGVLFIVLAILIAFGLDKQIETGILNAGFFDVTTVEQTLHQSLEGRHTLPQSNPSGDLEAASSSISGSVTYSPAGASPNAPQNDQTKTIVNSIFGPPPIEFDQGKFIEIVKPAGFVNSQPFKLADIVGKKVILMDFIDYSCINCERTFPYLNDWYSKYKDQGLEIVAIHTPEFAFEKDIVNVTAAAKQFKLQFPIVLDNDYATWNAYQNNSWPHKYLINIEGHVVYDHIGEGADNEIEAEIIKLLGDRKLALGLSGAITTGTPMPGYAVQTQSEETYFGAMRNEFFGNGQPGKVGESVFTIPTDLSPDAFYLGGDWNIASEYAEGEAAGTQLSFVFNAANVYLVAATADGTAVPAQVLIDGKAISSADSGTDVSNGAVTISGSRLYHLYAHPTAGVHRIDIIFSKKGARVFTFTFG